MRKNLLFFLMAMLLPGLASAYNHAITFSSGYSGSASDRVIIPYGALNPSTTPYTGSWSMGAWIRQTSLNAGGVVMGYTTTSHDNNNGAFVVQSTSSGLKFASCWGFNNNGSGEQTASVTIPLNEWHFVSASLDNEAKKYYLYYDGELVLTGQFKSTVDNFPLFTTSDGEDDGAFCLGGWGFLGAIDDFFIANRALSAEEMKAASTNPMGINGLTSFYDFDSVIEGTTGQFANLAPGFAADVRAKYTTASGSDWGNGVAYTYTNTESAPDLSTIDATTARISTLNFTVPSASDFENLAELYFMAGDEPLTAGETVSLQGGTQVLFSATAATGYVVAGLTVDGVAVETMEQDGTYAGVFTINSDLTKDSFVFTVTRTPYALTIAEAENGTVTVSANGEALENGAMVPAGTELTLGSAAADGYKLVNYTLNGEPVEGNTVEMPAEAATISAVFTSIDYCTNSESVSRSDRYVTSLEVNGVTVEGYEQTSSARPVTFDRTSTVVTATPGDEISIKINGFSEWMHIYVYGDFDKNGFNVDSSVEGLSGDLLWFNYYSIADNKTGHNSAGEQISEVGADIATFTPKFTLPADLAPGNYRMRFKTDWSCVEPCGRTSGTTNKMGTNGGIIIDFTLHVESAYYDAERTITLASDNAEAGTVAFVQPEAEGTSLATALKAVKVLATAAEGAEFTGWYNGEDLVSEDAEYTYTGEENITLTAHFVWTAKYAITINQPEEGGTIKVLNGSEEIASGDEVLNRTTLTIRAEAAEGYRLQNYVVNDAETTNTSVTVTGPTTISAVFVEGGVEYCEPTDVLNTDRNISSITASVEGLEDVIIPGVTTSSRPLFQDQTSVMVDVEPGQRINLTSAGSGLWMQTYVYVDFDQNGWNVDDATTKAEGDLVWFNAYSPGAYAIGNTSGSENSYPGYTYDGNTFSGSWGTQYGGVNSFIDVPVNIAPGLYRARYKVDWNCVDPCGSQVSANSIKNNGGVIIDFTIRVVSSQLEAPRTITVNVAEGQDELGTVAISAPETEGNSVTTDSKYVGIVATPAEGAQFLGWYKGDELVYSQAEIRVVDTEDATYTAHFGWTVNFEQSANGSLVVRQEGSTTAVASGTAFEPGTKLTVIATPDAERMLKELLINGEPTEVDENNSVVITVDSPVTISATFVEALFAYNATVTGNGHVEVWTAVDWDNGERPAGQKIEEGVPSFEKSEAGIAIYIFPDENPENPGEYAEVVAVTITGGPEMTPYTLDDLAPCTFDESVLTTYEIMVNSDINITANFSNTFAGIADIFFDEANGPVEYYTIQGVRVDSENLAPGVYIVRQGKVAKKVYIFAK